jgi:hypothetical protein
MVGLIAWFKKRRALKVWLFKTRSVRHSGMGPCRIGLSCCLAVDETAFCGR